MTHHPGSLMLNLYAHRRRSAKAWPRVTWGIEWNGVVRFLALTWLRRTYSVRWWRDQTRTRT